MKKVILSALAATVMLSAVMCGCSGKLAQSKDNNTSETELTKSADSNQSSNENQLFAESVATDFSTNDIAFYLDSISSYTALIYTNDSDYININVGFGEVENNIDLSFYTSQAEKEGYEVLKKALDSALLNLTDEEQVDILADYQNNKIIYDKNGIKIIDTGEDSTRVISIYIQK